MICDAQLILSMRTLAYIPEEAGEQKTRKECREDFS
jgi:hypothetical protein